MRHTSEENGIDIQSDGYVHVDRLLTCEAILKTRVKVTSDDVDKIVRDDEKERFSMILDKDGFRWIRANQGHSGEKVLLEDLCGVPIESLEEGEECIHGTKYGFLNSIINSDLKPGGTKGKLFRTAIHMTTSPPTMK